MRSLERERCMNFELGWLVAIHHDIPFISTLVLKSVTPLLLYCFRYIHTLGFFPVISGFIDLTEYNIFIFFYNLQ